MQWVQQGFVKQHKLNHIQVNNYKSLVSEKEGESGNLVSLYTPSGKYWWRHDTSRYFKIKHNHLTVRWLSDESCILKDLVFNFRANITAITTLSIISLSYTDNFIIT